MSITISQVVIVLNTYKKFCNQLQRDKKITKKNFQHIKTINALLFNRRDDIRAKWGCIFDEIYCLLDKPEIRVRIENNIHQPTIKLPSNTDLVIVKLIKKETQEEKVNFKNGDRKKVNKKDIKTNLKPSKAKDRKQKQQKNKNQNTKKLQKNSNALFPTKPSKKSMIRKIAWKVAQAKQEAVVRKKEKEQKVSKKNNSTSKYIYDNSSIFEDIMDERRAEGKGYGGSK